MSRIIDYTLISEASDDDVLIIDGLQGTRTIKIKDAFSATKITEIVNDIVDTEVMPIVEDAEQAAQEAVASVDGKADYPSKSISGTVVSFDDGIDAPVKSVELQINPVQDLHGYDNPWPAGGGKNLLLVSDETLQKPSYYGGTWEGTTVAQGENAITVTKGNSTGGFGGVVIDRNFEAGQYTFSCKAPIVTGGKSFFWGYFADNTYSGQKSLGVKAASTTNVAFTVTLPENTTSVFFKMTGINEDVPITFTELQFEKGSTATAYAPYSNLCPITGWTGATVTRTGKNLLGGLAMGQAIVNAVNDSSKSSLGENTDGKYVYIQAGTATSAKAFFHTFKPNTAYTLILRLTRYQTGTQLNSNIAFRYTDGTVQTLYFTATSATDVVTIAATSNASKTLKQVETVYGGGTTRLFYEQSGIFEGVLTADDFEPYNGAIYPVTWESAGTVYGGTLTVNQDGSADVVANLAYVDLGTLTWYKQSGTSVAIFTSTLTGKAVGVTNLICSQYLTTSVTAWNSTKPDKSICGSASSQGLTVRDESYSDSASFTAAMNGVQLVYELATPLTYHITAPQIRTILGENNMWADISDISVEYCINMQEYLDENFADKAGVIIANASGAIASFADGSDAPVKSLTVGIEPVQDLHGYDNPWPAGGGKNKFPVTLSSQVKNGTTFTVAEDGSVTISGTPSELTRVALNQLSVTPENAMKFSMTGSATGIRVFCSKTINGSTSYPTISPSVTMDAGAAYASFLLEVATTFSGTVTVKFQMEDGTTVTDWTPYSNICPITGWTGAEVTRTGENLLDKSKGHLYSNQYYIFGGNLTALDNTLFLKAGTYTVSTSEPTNMYLEDSNQNRIIVPQYKKTTATFENPKDQFCKFSFARGESSQPSPDNFDYQLELGSTASSYKPYQGATYPITWQSEAGTVYGGTLTINESGTGTLVADRARVVYDGSDDEMWERHSSGSASAFAMKISLVHAFVSSNTNIISNYLTAISSSATLGNYDNWISSSSAGVLTTGIKSITDVATWRTYLASNPLEVCYELATPQTYTLTAQQIKTLLGANNIWADTGDVAVEYRADTKLYIDNGSNWIPTALSNIIASSENDWVASRNYTAKELVIVNNRLYKVTANIASGGAITVGTNVTAITLSDIIKTLI